ncbi:MAG: phosphodiester glycosidase family protein [Anaerolineales bacterium]|nr:phosphodiester glycosidase family protein [Anaerolineales bacterium]
MKSAFTALRLALVFALLLPVSAAAIDSTAGLRLPDGWMSVAAGVTYQFFHLLQPRPINVFVARMDRANAAATLDTAIAQGSLGSGRESVRDMAARQDQALNYWGQSWGGRNRVVVAINGYFFNLNNGTPWSGQVQSGWYVQRFSDFVGDAGFAWGLNREAFIGDCVYHIAHNQLITDLDTGLTQKIHAVNTPRSDDQLVLYTYHYGATTRADSSGLEILVEMSRPSLILPQPARAIGLVTKMRDQRGATPIPFDHIVLSASGSVRTKLLDGVRVGDRIGVSQEITDCPASAAKYWTKTYASMGGDYHFLNGGVINTDLGNSDAAVPNSRTAIAFNKRYVYFIVVDGWNQGVSEGMKVLELASFAKNTLNATDGVSMDSGGSSTMVINGQVVNNTYCNFTRDCGMKPEGGEARQGAPRDGLAPTLEPLVGNAMLMVVVEPMAQSSRYQPTQAVLTKTQAALRLGPGNNYARLATIPENSPGMVLNLYFNDLNGVRAKGSYWWKVKFGGSTGWMAQENLQDGPGSPLEVWASNDGPTLLGEATTLRAWLSDGSSRELSWELGDGATASGELVTHTYAQAGVYQAIVTAIVPPTFLRATTTVIVPGCLDGCIGYFPLIVR